LDREVKFRFLTYFLFVLACTFFYAASPGDDLSSSYIGCLLISQGNIENLYDHHAQLFHVVDSRAWDALAAQVGFSGFLHPYVQIPLWAWLLQPLCSTLSFNAFSILFLALNLLSLVIILELCLRCWTPGFKSFNWLIPLLGAIFVFVPFVYAMWLIQTHLIFLAITMVGMLAAEHGRARSAGVLLAVAAAVKLTPVFLLIYWMVKKRFLAIAWFLVSIGVVSLITLALPGIRVCQEFIDTLYRVSNTLLVSFNNQSLSAWWAYDVSFRGELRNWRSFELSSLMKMVSLIFLLLMVILASIFSRYAENELQQGAAICLALASITTFSPIAWTHYYLVLLPAIMVLVQTKQVFFIISAGVVFLLNIEPLSVDPVVPMFTNIAIVRSHFFSALITMLSLTIFLGLNISKKLSRLRMGGNPHGLDRGRL